LNKGEKSFQASRHWRIGCGFRRGEKKKKGSGFISTKHWFRLIGKKKTDDRTSTGKKKWPTRPSQSSLCMENSSLLKSKACEGKPAPRDSMDLVQGSVGTQKEKIENPKLKK